jgi:PAS domain S-box-containing protein
MTNERILIVEDDEDIAVEVESTLAAHGYTVVGRASTGEAAVGLAENHRPHLVLMDIQLEGRMDGVQAAEQLRQRFGIPVLYLTAHAEQQTVARAKATAPAGYLLKPFSERELTITVEMALLRQQMEASLRAERERLNVTLRSIGDGVIATDVEARVVLLNSVAEELTGWKQDEAIGRPLTDVFHIINEKTREPCENPIERVFKTGRIIGLANHTALISREGIERSISDSGAPILDAASDILGAVLVFRDITSQLKIEQEMQKAQRLESVGVLAGGIAHDFNNLITVIAASISFAIRKLDPADSELASTLNDVLRACDQAARLTRQLLTFASGGAPVRKPTPLRELVQTTADFALRGSKSRCVYEMPDDLWPADIDEGQISQVITNLVMNADEAMPGGGVIEMRCANRTVTEDEDIACSPGRYVEIAITDHGVGMAPEIVDRIFEPYFSTKQRGSGLGLATAYSILKKHDGLLNVESQIGEGSTFRMLVPVAEALVADTEATSQTESIEARGGGRVLVMDDESALRAAMTAILRDLGYEVQDAADGAQTVQRFLQAKNEGRPFDLVLVDLTVRAGMGGLETVQQLLAIDPAVRAIAVSGYAPDPVLATPRKYGFVASLPKPYRREDLALLVQRVLRRTAPFA